MVTVEDGTVIGGFGAAVLEFMARHGYKNEVRILGLPDHIVEHGTPRELQRECGFDAEGILQTVRQMMNEKLIVTEGSIAS